VTRRTVRLTERRSREVRLPVGDVQFLTEYARHLIDVVPTLRPGVFRLTPREVVGWLDAPATRLAVRPKVPWPTVRLLLGLRQDVAPGGTADPHAELLDALAREFAERLRAVISTGLVPGYHERDATGAFLRGKLRTVDQLRDAAARAFPDRFHFTESVLDLDTPWNRIPRSIGAELLGHPDLGAATCADLRTATAALEVVPVSPVTDADFAAADAEPRAAHYRPLLALCRLLHDGFAAGRLPDAGPGAFLIDLSRAFERYLTESLTAELARRAGWSVEAQPVFAVGPTLLQPDVLVRRRGQARFVLDAKWKVPGAAPESADLHQVLAYSVVTGASRVGLVYPGRRFARRDIRVPGANVRVSLYRVQVVGTTDECERSVARLARVIRRKNGRLR
jgi:5-methylcytosine-specific restriction endonuclease McrBC regulatory subunit McrC